MLPFSAINVTISRKDLKEQVSVRDLSLEGFYFRLPLDESIDELKILEIEYDSLEKRKFFTYQVPKDHWSLEEVENIPEQSVQILRIHVEDPGFEAFIRCFMKEYTSYVRMKTEESDAFLSEAMTGYPAHLESVFPEDFDTLRKKWSRGSEQGFSFFKDNVQDCSLGIFLSDSVLTDSFLEKEEMEFLDFYTQRAGIVSLEARQISFYYFGSETCCHLVPEPERMKALITKIRKYGKEPVLVLPPLNETEFHSCITKIQKLHGFLMEQRILSMELVVNDFGLLSVLDQGGMPAFRITAGISFNKRKKDVRLPYVMDVNDPDHLLRENALNTGFYPEELKKRFSVDRFTCETVGYRYRLPEGKITLMAPFYLMNTGTFCPLAAFCETADRGKQRQIKRCRDYCREEVLLYPEFLSMVGRYNSIYGMDQRFFNDLLYLKEYLGKGVDRLILNYF